MGNVVNNLANSCALLLLYTPLKIFGHKVQDGKDIAFLFSKVTELPIFLASSSFSAIMLHAKKTENNISTMDFFNI